MKKLISYGLAAGVIAATSLIVATPAHAAMTMTVEGLPAGIPPQVTQGGSLVVNVQEDPPQLWCNESTGPSGYSMAIYLVPVGGGETIVLPEGVESGAQGFGNFGWSGSINDPVSATVVIPATVPVGEYQIAAACQNFAGFGVIYQEFKKFSSDTLRVNAPSSPAPADEPADQLPDTGQDDSAFIISGAVGAIALVAIGVAVIAVRRRVS
jgi:LPXTG-motif cell wall-anchored protein